VAVLVSGANIAFFMLKDNPKILVKSDNLREKSP
jgi:hypothetical protein